jgi:hypothetical protein
MQAVTLNPMTFSPEVLVNLARIVKLECDGERVVVQPLPRPGAEGVDGEEGTEEEVYTCNDILNLYELRVL